MPAQDADFGITPYPTKIPPQFTEHLSEWEVKLADQCNLVRTMILRNAHKGMRDVWTNQSWDDQLISLNISVQELRLALVYGVDVDEKAADIMAWAYIIADNWAHNAGIDVAGRPTGGIE